MGLELMELVEICRQMALFFAIERFRTFYGFLTCVPMARGIVQKFLACSFFYIDGRNTQSLTSAQEVGLKGENPVPDLKLVQSLVLNHRRVHGIMLTVGIRNSYGDASKNASLLHPAISSRDMNVKPMCVVTSLSLKDRMYSPLKYYYLLTVCLTATCFLRCGM